MQQEVCIYVSFNDFVLTTKHCCTLMRQSGTTLETPSGFKTFFFFFLPYLESVCVCFRML